MFSISSLLAQSRIITGKVIDKENNSIAGVTVLEDNTNNMTVTDANGEYKLNYSGKGKTLSFQFLGFTSQTILVNNKSIINVTLLEDTYTLDNVVVIGYGSVKQRDLTTAVSIVKTEDLESRPITTVSGALQGKAAGVQVVQASGSPGQGMVVRVRGASSISSSNDPLYVVDGVPMGEGNYNISFLSPDQIESMQVLKDASSAAIYGSRAANGVVLITTKHGQKNKSLISFSAYTGISKVAKTYDVLNVSQYKDLMDETGLINLPDGLKDNTDWFDEAYNIGINQNYQLSISGGNDKVTYYVGGGYTDEEGVLDVAYSKRYNIKANVDAQVRDWLKVKANVTYATYSNNGIISGTGSNRAGVVLSVINTPTYAKEWDPDNPGWYWSNFYGANLTTPLENMGRSKYNTNKTDQLIGTISGEIKLLKNLIYKPSISIDKKWIHTTSFLDPIATSYGRTEKGNAYASDSDDRRITFDNIFTYDVLSKNQDHKLSLMGGTSWTKSNWSNLWGSRSNFSNLYDNAIIGLNGGNNGGLRGQGENYSEWAIMSFLARANYDYKGRYLFTANFRSDGSSKLAPKGRWGYFPSFSAGWRISEEDFMKNIEWLDDMKIRGGWGQTGNQAGLADYAYLQMYSTNYSDWTDSNYADATPTLGGKSNIKNEDLTWETTTQTNIGVDMSMFDSRLSLTLDAYYKYTSNMLMTVPLPSPNPDIIRNEGEMSNKGLELSLASSNIRNKDFTWNTNFNISLNRNKLEKLDFQQVYYYGVTSEALSEYVVRMTPGEPLSKFWGYISEGVDPESGDIIYKDLDGNGLINSSDKTYIGNANPKFTFGLTNNLSYKGFNLNILISGSYGNDIYNASRIEMVGMYNGSNQITDVLERWRIPGQITDMPRANNLDNLKASTRWVEDGSYIKVKNITLSYDFNVKKLNKYHITKIQPYITLENCFTITNYSGYDPEVSQYSSATTMGIDWGTYPHVRTAVFGININF